MSILPGKLNLKFWRGSTFQKRVILWQDDAQTMPVDLTGYTAYLAIYDTTTSAELMRLTSPSNGIAITPTTGTLDLYIASEATQSFTWDYAAYQLAVVSVSHYDYPIMYGLLIEQFVV